MGQPGITEISKRSIDQYKSLDVNECIRKAVELTVSGARITKVRKELGFELDQDFIEWRKANPAFNEALAYAREYWCEDQESRIPLLLEEFSGNFRQANSMFEYIKHVLAIRMPSRYSQRIDINLNQNISIQSNIASANDRLNGLMREVIDVSTESTDKPIQLSTTTQSK